MRRAPLVLVRRSILISLVLFAGLVLHPPPASAESPLAYLFSWVSPGPSGIIVHPSATYVVNRYFHRIQKFSSTGTLLTEWGSQGTGDGQFQFPYGVATDSAGNVYVSDRENHRIQKFSSDGAYIGQWGSQGSGDGQFVSPLGVAVGPDENIYVADNGNSRIQKFTTGGAYLSQWGAPGSGPGEFAVPAGITLDSDGNVYVVDSYNQRVQKFTPAGVFLSQWGSFGSGDGQFQIPEGIAVDGDSVYVADTRLDRIQKFTRSGGFLSAWGSTGSGPGRFSSPTGIAIGDSGHVYVTDFNNSRVQVFGRRNPAVLRVPDDYPNIQAAVTAAGVGDTVLVAPGVYPEHIDFGGKSLILASEFLHDGDNATIAATVIDGGASGTVVNFHTGEDATCAVIGFTVRNGNSFNVGGGVYCAGANPRLEHLIVRDNTAQFGGGGIGVQYEANPSILDCTITANSAPHGGGIWGGGVIGTPGHRCNIYNNIATSTIYGSNPCGLGADLENVAAAIVYVDTFTVVNPDEALVNPPSATTLSILHGYYPPLVAADVYVSPTGDNANTGLTPAAALRNPSFALMRAQAGPGNPMRIHLLPGVYSASLTGEKTLHAQSFVSLIGEDSATTVIDGDAGNCVLYSLDETGFTISGITFRNSDALHLERSNPTITLCSASSDTGATRYPGGIPCRDQSRPTITRCTFSGNLGSGIRCESGSDARIEDNVMTDNIGGGVWCDQSNAVIRGNLIAGNAVGSSPGITCIRSNADIRYNRIGHSTYGGNGGGIVTVDGVLTIFGNEITDNVGSGNGGGIYCQGSNAVIDSNLIAANRVTGPVARGGGLACASCNAVITRNRFVGNSALNGPDFFDTESQGGAIFIDSASPVIGGSAADGNLFLNNRALSGADLYTTNAFVVINAQWNHFRVYPVTSYYATPLSAFDLSNGSGDQPPIDQDLYVAPGGDDGNSGVTPAGPLRTIQFALSRLLASLENPITIHLEDGLYAPDTNGETFPLPMASYVTLRGNGPQCILDARRTGGVIVCNDVSNVTISRLTLKGGQSGGGGGVSFRAAMACSLVNSAISGNLAFLGAGILCTDGSDPVIAENLITHNQTRPTPYFANVGGGMFAYNGARPYLIQNVIAFNTAQQDGGGAACYNRSDVRFVNNAIVFNTAVGSGGALSCFDSQVEIVNSIVWGNTAPTGSQLYGLPPTVTYSDIAGGFPGKGNIDADPLFVDGAAPYTLQPGSPCVDAGNPVSDFFDPEDPAHPKFALYPAMGTRRNDMGAYGGPGHFDLPTAVTASLEEAHADPGRVRLTWSVELDPGVELTVMRSRGNDAWESRGAPIPRGLHRLDFVDSEVEPRARYGYRLVSMLDGTERVLNEVWVTVPSELRFTLEGPRTQPIVGDFTVVFSLATGEPARLELLDVAGRRVVSREVGALGSGSHTENMGRSGTISPGVYFIRLTQGAQSVAKRAVVMQ